MSSKSSHLHSVGDTYHHFKLVKTVNIPELQCLLRELIHEPTGARVMHIANQDPENLFCLSFRTLPYNSNGVAHILEHTVLCGSKNFPIKDPFFAMNRRSLNTFMNALTGPDFTCYPAASQVTKDFYNLLEVYLDAVFHPNLNKLSFLQEGHRLEFSQPNDPMTPLEYKGVVYNEMKGALASGSTRLDEAINETLFPNTPYGYDSGGDPRVIPQLTYAELKQFYELFYHPSRCLFFFYGNLPLESHLDFISKQTLDHTTGVPPLPPIPLQPRFKAPVYRELSYPVALEEKLNDKAMIGFGWLTCHLLEQQEVLALNILEIILLDTDASPLKQALLQSGLCKQVLSSIDVEINEIPWTITLKGCEANHADAIEKIILLTLQNICQTGIPLEMVENAIHQLEFHRSEIIGDHTPFGLSLFMRSALLKQHGADSEEGLMIHQLFERLHETILANPNYLTDLIQKYLLENPHRTRIIMRPDPYLEKREREEEHQKLAAIQATLSEEQIHALLDQAASLEAFQQKQENEDLDILPKVSLSDIPLSTKDYPLKETVHEKLTVFHHPVFTNDIVYADLVFDLPNLTEDELPYLRLLLLALPQIGCGDRSYIENLNYIQGHTGGIGAGISLNLQALHHTCCHPTFHLRGKALHRKASKLFPLLHDLAASPCLTDLDRLKTILIKHFTGMESRLNQSALKYAINLSASGLNVPSKVANDLYGLNYYWKIREIMHDLEKQIPHVLSRLQQLQERVLCLEHPRLVLGCDAAMYDELKGHHFYGLSQIKTTPFEPWQGNFPLQALPPQGRVIASPVAFIGKVLPTISYTHPLSTALSVATFLLDNLSLHAKIREQGGAYGGGAVCNTLSGNFYFYSYRDPNIVSTLKAFEEAIQVIVRGEFNDSHLEEAKMEMIQELDAPLSPGSQAEVAFCWKQEERTLELRQINRNRLLALTCDDIIEAVELFIAKRMDQGVTVVCAGHALLERANQELQAEGLPPLMIQGI